jgi:hypothetical protein
MAFLKQRKINPFLFFITFLYSQCPEASFVISHQGGVNPLTEGFQVVQCCGIGFGSPIENDLSLPAWSIGGLSQSYQYGYSFGALTSTQKSDIAKNGFELNFTARVLQNLAPLYDNTNFITIGGASFYIGPKAFGVFLGLNNNGDTVVVTPTSFDSGGIGNAIRSPGLAYTLPGSENKYNNYQLKFNPVSNTADLLVNGIVRIQGYNGHTSFLGDAGLLFEGFSGGEIHFHSVEVSSVPLPPAFLMFGSALFILVMPKIKKCKKALFRNLDLVF